MAKAPIQFGRFITIHEAVEKLGRPKHDWQPGRRGMLDTICGQEWRWGSQAEVGDMADASGDIRKMNGGSKKGGWNYVDS